jgi:hypothetical protein
VAIDQRGPGTTLIVDAIGPSGRYRHDCRVSATVRGPRDHSFSDAVPQTAPGKYRRTWHLNEVGLYDVTLTLEQPQGPRQQARCGFAVDYGPELRAGPVEEELLEEVARITGGIYRPQPEQIFAEDRTAERRFPLWAMLLLAALLLYVLDVLLRRMRWNPPAARAEV